MIYGDFKKYYDHPFVRTVVFIAVLWLAIHILVESGVFGGRYKLNLATETTKSYIDKSLISLSIPIFLCALFINPFYSLFRRNENELEKITGLEEFHWNQARAIVNRYGEEAPAILAIRSGDDILTAAQKQDFLKSKLAAETILKATKM